MGGKSPAGDPGGDSPASMDSLSESGFDAPLVVPTGGLDDAPVATTQAKDVVLIDAGSRSAGDDPLATPSDGATPPFFFFCGGGRVIGVF